MKLKVILITLIALVVLAVAALFIGRNMVIGYLTPEFLTEQIESRWNCRAKIDSVESSVLGTSTVKITGLTLFPREDTARMVARAPIHAETVDLEVKTADLIARRLRINHLELSGVSVNSKVSRDGKSSLAELFQPVDDAPVDTVTASEVTAAPVPVAIPEAAASDVIVVKPVDLGIETEDAAMDVGDLPVALLADRFELKDANVNVFLESSSSTVSIDNFSIAFTEIDVNPRDLNAHNRAKFQFGGDLKVVDSDTTDLLTAHVDGLGDIKPFNAATGTLDPAWAVDLTISKGAQMNTFPVLEKIREMLGKIDTAGIDLSNLTLRGELMADAKTQITQYQGKYRFDQPLILQLPDTGLAVKEKSWVDTATNQHMIKGSLILSPETTKAVEKMVDQYLAKKTKGFRINGLKDIVLSPVKRGDTIILDVISQGDMSDPKADIATPFGNLSEMIGGSKDAIDDLEKVGKSLLDSLLGK